MARWTFFVETEQGVAEVREADQYNPEDAEKKRQQLLRVPGGRLIIKIDGKEVRNDLALK